MSACTDSRKKQTDKIEALEYELFSESSGKINQEKTKLLADSYIAYADQYPDDSLSPGYLFKAADVHMNLLDPRTAIQLFDRILNNYPDFEKQAHCLFLKAYVFENELRILEQARQLYEDFLKKYPNHEFADDAEISIKNLGKTPEELIEEFSKMKQPEQ